mgnify:FL=1
MKVSKNINPELLEILTPYAEWFFSQTDHDKLREPDRRRGFDIDTGTSEKYMNELVGKDGEHEGYPETAFCCDIGMVDSVPTTHREKQQKLNRELISFLGAKNNAVHVYYPENGFMGWHTNWNASGYNILITYNAEENGGFFRYLDPVTKEIVTMVDPVGWSCKVGHFGDRSDPNKIVYHCCGNSAKRLTLGYVVPHLEIWRSMIKDISGEDASHFS